MSNKKQTPQHQQARKLYFKTELTQEQIAGQVGVAQKTISLWMNEGKWKLLKDRSLQTPVVLIEQMTCELIVINNAIRAREPGQRFPSLQDAEIRRKIMSSINILKQQQSAGTNIEVMLNFLHFVMKQNLEQAKVIVEYAELYLKGENMVPLEYRFMPYTLPGADSYTIQS